MTRWLAWRGTTPLLAIVLLLLSWPVPLDLSRTDLDQSWQVALGYALDHGIRFGSNLVFTYGPLGFATITPLWLGPISLPGLVVAAGVQFALVWVTLGTARRHLPFWAAIVVAYLAARAFTLFQVPEAMFALTTAAALALLIEPRSRDTRWGIAVAVACGIVAGLGVLTKVSDGVFMGAVLGIATVGREDDRRRRSLVFAGSGLAAFLVVWVWTGQALTDIPAYVVGSYEIIRGYSAAMDVPIGTNAWFFAVFAAGVGLGAWLLWPAVRRSSRWPRLAIVLIGLVAAFALFKIMAVRQGPIEPLAGILLMLLALSRSERGRRTFVAATAVLLVPLLLAENVSLASLGPADSIGAAADQARIVLEPWRWTAEATTSRSLLQEQFPLPPEILAALAGHSTIADPWQAGVFVAWPQLTWQPLPVFQSYTAYTPYLDQLNALVLAGSNAPERILRRARGATASGPAGITTIDGRNPWFEAPAAMLQTFCRYDELVATSTWEVLGLTTRQCGSPVAIGSISAATGAMVAIPASPSPDDFLIVQITGLDSLRDQVVTTLAQGPIWQITLDGSRTFRLLQGTAGDGLLLAVPASIVRSAPFGFGPPHRSLAVSRFDGRGGTVTFSFFAVPLG